MTTWADFVTGAKNRNLIRKSLDAVVLVAVKATPLPSTIINNANELTIPPAYKSIGWHTDDGLQWSREVENSELAAHGSAEAVRTDTRRVNNSLEVTAMETNLQTLGLSIGLQIAASAGGKNEIVLTEPSLPKATEFRMLALSVDETEFGDLYSAKLYSSAKVTATNPGAWTDGDSATGHGFTVNAFRDPTAGYGVRHFLAGPGFTGLRAAMGFDPIA